MEERERGEGTKAKGRGGKGIMKEKTGASNTVIFWKYVMVLLLQRNKKNK